MRRSVLSRPAGNTRPVRTGHRDPAGRLDPTGRWWSTGRHAPVRLLLAAVLLVTAAGVLYTGAELPLPSGTPTGDPGDATGGRPGATRAAAGLPPPGRAGTEAGSPGAAAAPRLPVPAGLVGVPVLLRDPTVTTALWPGDRVDLLVVDPDGGTTPAAVEVLVLAVDRPVGGLLVAVPPGEGRALLTAPTGTRYLVLLRPDLSPSAAGAPPATGRPAASRTRPRSDPTSARHPRSPAGRRPAKRLSSPTSLSGAHRRRQRTALRSDCQQSPPDRLPGKPIPGSRPGSSVGKVSYPGPPINPPPPSGWRPPMVWRPPPPRQLPTQDHPALDAAERAAHRFTWAVAAAAGAVALLVLCALAARLVG